MDDQVSTQPIPQLRDRLKRAIGYRARTQKEVAEAIGLSQKSMSKLMRGETINPGARLIYDLAKELDVSADFLYGLSEDIEIKTKPTPEAAVKATAPKRARTPARAAKG
jgi:transcriptional regulator with XRE-family HTH domain